MEKSLKLISCQALAHLIDPVPGAGMERVVLPMSLHVNPNALKARLIEEVERMEKPGGTILLGYGLCGRALEGVWSRKSRMILPRVDDCVGAVLGSRARHKSLLEKNPGCFFLEPSWIGTDIDVFTQVYKGLDRIPEESREDIVCTALKNYKKLALIRHGNPDEGRAVSECLALAQKHRLEFARYKSNLSLLKDLARGPWDPGRFVCVEPGQKIPFF